MKREHGQCILEHLVELGRVADAVLHQVKIIVRIDRRELAAQHQRIAMANEDGFDDGEIFSGLHASWGLW